MTGPGDFFRRLVCGYASPKRREKRVAVLQAYIDDSASKIGDRTLYLAALIHRADAWEQFSNDWDAALRAEPRIEYFKMVEAQNRRGEFKGWSEAERNAKVLALATIIERFQPLSLVCSVSVKHTREVLKPHAPYGLGSEYFPISFAMICGIARIIHGMGIDLPCDVIFDKQDNVSKHVLIFFDHIMQQQPQEWAQYVSTSPIFRDDREVLPLQAADLFAWHVRRDADGNYPREYESVLDMICVQGANYKIEITNEIISDWAEGMKQIPGSELVVDKKAWKVTLDEILRQQGLG